MPKFEITYYEEVPVTRTYVGHDSHEALEKMDRWVSAREDEGRVFGSKIRVDEIVEPTARQVI